MWLLEHETLFPGKRTWLRPGSQYLFGRTTAKSGKGEDGNTIGIESKQVSRQHMMLKVLEVPAGDGTKLHARTPVEITDLSCKRTIVDGERRLQSEKKDGTIVKYDAMTLTGTEHTIRLAPNYPEFKISWHPVVFTFASRDGRAQASQLHAIDIKTTTDFVHGQTTHVISLKRNLPKVLLGLCAATHIVTPDFIDAVVGVASPQNRDPDQYKGSKLEEDFDAWWPKEEDYIPPRGQEPVRRPENMLRPDARRSEVFSGLTFIFLNESQYETLQDSIAAGGGKALLYNLRFGETTVDEYVEFVRNVAGEKGRRRGPERLPVVTIRLSNYPEGMEEWALDFVTGVDQALNQRSIQQNEFLDAILTVDTSSLLRPPAQIEVGSSMPELTQHSVSRERIAASQSAAPPKAPEPTLAPTEPAGVIPRKRVRRGITQSRFTGFDDYEPPSKFRKTQDEPMEDVKISVGTQIAPTQASSHLQTEGPASTQISRRAASPAVDSVEEIDEDELFPAAAELKRRRAATRGVTASVEPEASAAAATKPKTKAGEILEHLHRTKQKVLKDVNVQEQTKKRLQEEEEKRRADEENLREALQGVDISDIRGLVQVEEMEVLPRQRRTAQRAPGPMDRWNDEWNGRKNFKKFRRRGVERGPERPQKMIVALEEAKSKKGVGTGDAFFLEDSTPAASRRTQEERREERGRRARALDSESEVEQGFTRRRRTQEREVIHVEDSLMDDEAEEVAESSTTLRDSSQRVVETQSQVTETQRQTQTLRKRPPITVAAGQRPSKKARGMGEDDSDAEETGFRLRRRR
ncbi:uncharacterized protein EI97DRAFT_467623 [Westerdykella ornata]|uniref:FHA domain-containing protein n=1 Tax=Westerdykella ornata TaxID=318751 RepID=A0A6A6JJP1_WESOR|nr:uncharacterized protein EI97DRAFT_467623 [Westerdykella ornata]KAF2275906.1 hypothetical protein EI97DRAFT_467623 [Westerdykella ornata]